MTSLAGATASASSSLPTACIAAVDIALFNNGWTEDSIANAYGFAPLLIKGDLGAGQTIALVEFDTYLTSDLATFDRCYFGSAAPAHVAQVTNVDVDGDSLVGPGLSEATLDVQELSALAPDAKILVYQAPDTDAGQLDDENEIVSQDRANIVSMSYGLCETVAEEGTPGYLAFENTVLEEAAAEGQTVVASSGDTGDDTCASSPFGHGNTPAAPDLSVDDPASQPYALGAGGASLETDTTPPEETTWNNGANGGGSGGGLSNTWPSPAWQADSGVPGTASGPRQVPDVAGSADPERGVTLFSELFAGSGGSITRVVPISRPAQEARRSSSTRPEPVSAASRPSASSPIPPGWSLIGGTSASAPQWAAALAIIADSPSCSSLPKTAGGPDLGFVVPDLYEIAANPSAYDASFTQVRTGTNDIFGLDKGYSAGPDYNMVTGLGTPLLAGPSGQDGLAANLCKQVTGHALSGSVVPVVTGVTPSSGSLAGGGTATISGRGFATGAGASLVVQFGSVTATVKHATKDSLVVVVPPAAVPGGSPSYGAPTPVDVVVTERSGAEPVTSNPTPGARYSYVAVGSTGSGLATVTAITPPGGLPAGRNPVVVYGNGFHVDGGVTSVTFGGVAAHFKVVSDNELIATAPRMAARTACSTGIGFTPASLCQVEVEVSNASGPSPTEGILPPISGPIDYDANGLVKANPETEPYQGVTEYDYAPDPVITSITPDPADYQGTSPITVHGRNLSFLTTEYVDFGATNNIENQAKVPIIYETSNVIELDPNAAPTMPGALPIPQVGGVSVLSLSGNSNVMHFGWAGIPTVSGLSSLGGPQTGGELVTLHGLGLADVDQITVESEIADYPDSTARVLHHLSSTAVQVRLPAYLPGPAAVLACSQSGCARENPKTETYVYYDAGSPTVLAPTVSTGPASGGTQVILYGFNIDSATSVRFGSIAGTVERFAELTLYPDGDPFLLPVLSPPGIPGSKVAITVVTPTGTSTTASPVFSYSASAPSPPQGAVVVAGPPAVTVMRWQAPLVDGGSPVQSYTVVAVPDFGAPSSAVLPGTARSYDFRDLHAGVSYAFRVAASNASHGEGPSADAGTGLVPYRDDGYRVVTASGTVTGAGSLASMGGISAPPSAPVVGIATTHDALGYWLAQSDGTVTPFGDAPPLKDGHPGSPIVGIASTSTGLGYWLLERNGTVLSFGDAPTFAAAKPLPASDPAVAIAVAPNGTGYVVLAEHGQLFSYDASGSGHATAPLPAGSDAVGLAWLTGGLVVLTSNGEVLGGPSSTVKVLPASAGTAVSIVATPDLRGYWVLSSSGTVVAHGDAGSIPSGLSASSAAAASAVAIADV
jgi:hypothetical protein